MANKVHLEVITPSKIFFSGDVEMVVIKTALGEEGFMAHHSHACKLLVPCRLKLKMGPGKDDYKYAAIAGGFIDVKDNIIIFTDAAEWPEDIDVQRAMETKGRMENWLLANPDEDDDNILIAETAIAKAIVRMNVKENGQRYNK